MKGVSESNQAETGQLTSAIYQGQVRHRRFTPRKNKFTYQLHMFAINLDELDSDHATHLKAQGPFGYSWFSPMRLCQKDYVKGDLLPLRARIEYRARALGHKAPINEIVMLVQVRCFGFYFSPANFYFCYNEDNECNAMLVEVSNTPWNQRHYYLVDLTATSLKVTDKNFHVSPFMDLAMKYHWRVQAPSHKRDGLTIHIDNCPNIVDPSNKKTFFDVTLALTKREITPGNLFSLWINMPIMTLKIVAGIYWQALKLFIKRIPFVSYQKTNDT